MTRNPNRRRVLTGGAAGLGAVAVAVTTPSGTAVAATPPSVTFENVTVEGTLYPALIDQTSGGAIYTTGITVAPIESRDQATFQFDASGGFVSGPTTYDPGDGSVHGFGTSLHVEANAGPGDALTVSAQQGRALQVTQSAGALAAVTVGNAGSGPGLYVKNTSTTSANAAVQGIAGAGGRGGKFTGGAAQISLTPGGGSSHPASGSAGDLYVDKTYRLWFCKGGTAWKQLA